MKFGPVPLDEAVGAILAHSQRVGERMLRKGRVLSADDIAALRQAGHEAVIAARLDPGDMDENAAAAHVAAALAGENAGASRASTGRCNLYAEARGLAIIDPARVDRLNGVDEALTLATVAPFELVEAGQMVATVKVITFGIDSHVVEAGAQVAREGSPLIRVAALRPMSVGLIQTRLPGIKESVLDKTTQTSRTRLEALGSTLSREIRCAHTEDDVAAALAELRDGGCDIVLVLGASAMVDRRDVVPASVEQAGGTVEHLGMPVDPGNLMMLARLGGMRVLGLPGSARSPRLHGSDWVLRRLIAGIPVTGRDLMGMGVGGLLKEIPGRPLPRAKAAPRARGKDETGPASAPAPGAPPRIAILILAAGQSRRMGQVNKLLAEIDGEPMVARVVAAAQASRAEPVIVVTGHQEARVRAALADHGRLHFVLNDEYRAGLSTSLRAGLRSLADDIDGVLVCLGDMPRISAAHLDRLIDGFDPAAGQAICVPSFGGNRGNPVLWARRFFAEMMAITGDVGARHLIGEHEDLLVEIEMDDEGVLVDVDSPAALTALHSAVKGSS